MNEDNTVNASVRTLEILETLSERDGMGVTELAGEFDLPKSTVHNHLNTLKQKEYIVVEEGKYKTGLRFLKHGARARSRHKLYVKGKPEVDKLAQETGELANIATEEYGRGVYLYLSRGDQAVQLDTYPGLRFNLHCTALGKAILAEFDEDRTAAIIDEHGLPARTENTITDRDRLRRELTTIRDQGYAVDRGERLERLQCLAAPIHRQNGEVIGGISVSGPTSRMRGERFEEEIPELVLDAANVIELNIKYS